MVFLLGWIRSFGPDIRQFEMFMDEGFIAAIMRSPHMPPNDMWFAGYSINYYYYAHFTIATAAKLLGQSPSIAFNTGICMFFGLTASNLFGVTCNIASWARYLRTSVRHNVAIEKPDSVYPSLLSSIPFGFLSMIMGLILGNLAATQQWWQNHGNVPAADLWFGPSRVIDKTINEFPAFSFLLSCFHAHVLALAFTILAIGMAFNLLLESDGWGLFAFGRSWWHLGLTLVVTALVIGGLFVMNGWNYPTYMGLALACIGLQQWLAYGARFHPRLLPGILMPWGSLVALSLVLYLPFYLQFVSPSQGIGLVSAADRSPISGVLLIYGLFAFVFCSLLLASVMKRPLFSSSHLVGFAENPTKASRWSRIGIIGIACFIILCLIILLVLQNSLTLLVATTIALAGVVLLIYHIGDRAHAFTLLLGALAFALIAGCEIFFLRDVFADSYPRMNTVFKFYFQAWALLAIASGAGVFFILENLHPLVSMAANMRRLQRLLLISWGIGLVVLVLAACVYPLTAPTARYTYDSATQRRYLARTNSLDGLAYLKTDPANPGDYDAIRWLNANVQGDPVIVESIGGDKDNVGGDYSNYARVSTFTGLPTPMGWAGHEYQWRVRWLDNQANSIEVQIKHRIADVDTIYTATNPATVLAVMARYNAYYRLSILPGEIFL
jgi:YYY domain-containing protein